jgi:hypothetical protein
MIKITNTEVFGWDAAIRGMRNPMNSWDKSDSEWCLGWCDACPAKDKDCKSSAQYPEFVVGVNDLDLMKKLVTAGSDHAKFMRMINVTMDITAPLYWWKECDTYKVGTVANSCSTMHKIADKEFKLDDFSHEHLTPAAIATIRTVIERLNFARKEFLKGRKGSEFGMPSAKEYWWDMIQLLPSSYNQKRTVQLNYAVLRNMYHARRNHKLDEWRDFCSWVESLPYAELITLGGNDNGKD